MNRIGEILNQRGIGEMIPSEQILDQLQIKMQTWNKWVNKKKDPEMWQLPIIARFLDCEIIDLFPSPEDKSIRSKHGLITA